MKKFHSKIKSKIFSIQIKIRNKKFIIMFVLPKARPVPVPKKQSSETEVSCHHVPNDEKKFYFCFNGGTLDDMFKGILIDLDTSMNPIQCQEYLQSQLSERIDMKDKQIIVYLSGGIPFIGGKIEDLYSNEDFKFGKVIYGIITKKVSSEIINKSCPELCNISDHDHQLLVSPLCESSIRGMSDMACILGYLNHQFSKTENILLSCSKVITFAPFITSIKRIIDGNQVIGRDVITVTSTFYTYFRSLIPPTTNDEFVYEYAFHICNIICKIDCMPKSLPLLVTDVTNKKFLTDLDLGPLAYIWLGDSDHDFNRFKIKVKGAGATMNAYGKSDPLKPIAPLSSLNNEECAIVKGKDHEFLYLERSPLKGDIKNINKIDIINPMTGLLESVDTCLFAKEQGESMKMTEIIDPFDIKQIIIVDLECSNSMNCELSDNENRLNLTLQYLSFFANRIYGFHIPTINGLISFNEEINIQCPLSPFVSDFDEGLKKIQPGKGSKLWDSLDRSCDEIIKIKKEIDGFKNAVLRILVICCGNDEGSETRIEEIVKKFISNKIVVDSIIFDDEKYSKMLCAVCHATGGLSFRMNDVCSYLSLFEQSAFFNIEERKRYLNPIISGDRSTIQRELKPEMITCQFLEKAKDCAAYDTNVLNNEILFAQLSERPLDTPAHICSLNKKHIIKNSRMKKIFYDVYLAALATDPKQPSYDPNVKIFIYKTMFERWKVFLKGPEGTPYENKWWYIYVNIPRHYPYQPPFVRFISIPYHLNIALDGCIIFNIKKNEYNPSKSIIEIIKEIRESLIHPDEETPSGMEILELFKNKHDEYEKLARKSAEDNAKDDYNDYITSSVDDSVPDGFTLTRDEYNFLWK